MRDIDFDKILKILDNPTRLVPIFLLITYYLLYPFVREYVQQEA